MIIYCKRVDEDRYVLYCECCLDPVTSCSGKVLSMFLAKDINIKCQIHADTTEPTYSLLKHEARVKWERMTTGVYKTACLLLHISTKPGREGS